ncbi:hypothetical protein [Aquimarina sediminis]|uniref:hypothetical protein n=1 Tax=Aquimarina sediminis TaxID=2070536 RepID=UPI000CA041E8|nr:hypothetical protein [Aquimarina sediminis]
MKNKILKISKRTLISIGVLFVFIYVTNEILYRISIPQEFNKANWNGKWNSTEYKLVNGKILTFIPNPIIENSDFKSKTALYYNIWSLYKPGQIKIVDMNGTFRQKNFNGNSMLNQKNAINRKPLTSFFFKAKISFANGQSIEYTGEKSNKNPEISGNYISKFPFDSGSFIINLE